MVESKLQCQSTDVKAQFGLPFDSHGLNVFFVRNLQTYIVYPIIFKCYCLRNIHAHMHKKRAFNDIWWLMFVRRCGGVWVGGIVWKLTDRKNDMASHV